MRPLSAAELEMMNLTGDGNGIDMIKMPAGVARTGAHREFLPAREAMSAIPIAGRANVVVKAARHDQCQDG